MKRIYIYIAIVLMALSSCRPKGDDLLSYGQNDKQAYLAASYSFAEQFKVFWLAMNENYPIWDYEEQCGMDWDEVYTTYLPKFEALDERQDPVTDDELKELYQSFVDSLHDGHMYVVIQNIKTGRFFTINPNRDRNYRERSERFTAELYNITTLDAYCTTGVNAKYQTKAYDATGSALIMAEAMDSTASRLLTAADAYLAAVDAAGGPNAFNDSLYASIQNVRDFAVEVLNFLHTYSMNDIAGNLSAFADGFLKIRTKYSVAVKQLGVTVPIFEDEMVNDGLKSLSFALFEGNIAYLRIGGFRMTYYLNPSYLSSDTTSLYYAYQKAVNRVWHHWFDTIQSLHASGQLGGVILDVRNNGGGLVNDYQYAMGALLPSGGWKSHTLRVKNGLGRLDFAPLTPFYVCTYNDEHAVITQEPIVVLANSASGSMAENTTWGVISQPNGYFIGTRTYGALSALSPDPSMYSEAYSGAFGVKNVTPVYGYIPKYVCLYDEDLHVVEGHGFDPNEDLPLDVDLWKNTGRDNQLERALDYIQTH